jgi:hypothetical protein
MYRGMYIARDPYSSEFEMRLLEKFEHEDHDFPDQSEFQTQIGSILEEWVTLFRFKQQRRVIFIN